MTESYIVASADRCTVHPQHVMVNQGRSEELFADLFRCDCGKVEIGNTDERRAQARRGERMTLREGWHRVLIAPERQNCTQWREAIAFCEANGLDARKIPARGSLRIVGEEIHYREKAGIEGDQLVLTGWRVVPMVSPPWEHGLASVEVPPPADHPDFCEEWRA